MVSHLHYLRVQRFLPILHQRSCLSMNELSKSATTGNSPVKERLANGRKVEPFLQKVVGSQFSDALVLTLHSIHGVYGLAFRSRRSLSARGCSWFTWLDTGLCSDLSPGNILFVPRTLSDKTAWSDGSRFARLPVRDDL